MTHTETNKLHDALKNDELMKEVGRLATEEQKKIIETNKPVEDWEEEFDDLLTELLGQSDYSNYIGSFHQAKIKNFIRETREQAYQKGLDDGYSEGFRACERGVTP